MTVQRHRWSVVVRPEGEVDVLTAPDMHEAIEQAVDERPRLLVVDLSKVEFLGCAGLSVLVTAKLHAGWRTCLRVVATDRVTRRPLELTGLDQRLTVYDSLDAALTSPIETGHVEG
ncbi:STAS domain-containing protein [Prauserella marina]|uniref:STAS domain-containing protein n=1 Tax=Prauserella marina TaxID=530584 RepID=UPI001472D844|nr:STAS domain-containing protein [Prauserella marina]